MANTNSRYTYVTFGNEVVNVVKMAVDAKLIDTAQAERMTEKAQALIGTQTKKAEYNKLNPKKSAPKGASAETLEKAERIKAVLNNTAEKALTTAEINEIAGTSYTALQVVNAIKFIDGATKTAVIRETVNAKGLKAQKEYAAYFLQADSE